MVTGNEIMTPSLVVVLNLLDLEYRLFDLRAFAFRASGRRFNFASILEGKVALSALSRCYHQFFLRPNRLFNVWNIFKYVLDVDS